MIYRSIVAVLALTAGTAILIVSTLELYEARAIDAANDHLGWGRLEEAESVLREAIELVPSSPQLHAELSRVLVGVGRWRKNPIAAEEARLELATAAALNPLDGMAWGDYGELLRRGGEPFAAIAAIQRGLTRDPNNVYLLGLLGQAQMDAQLLGEAVATFERAQAIRPTRQIATLLDEARAASSSEGEAE